MEFKLICTESAPGQETVESSITVICANDSDIDNAKQAICSFMDNKKVFKNTMPGVIMNLPLDKDRYLLKNTDRIIYFQPCEEGWDYSIHFSFDTVYDDPIDGGVLTNSSLTAANAAMAICLMFGINPYSLANLTPSEEQAFFEL